MSTAVMEERTLAECADCEDKKCAEGRDCFGLRGEILKRYDGELMRLYRAASEIEALFYCQKTRLEEAQELIRRAGYKTVGVAFCVGMAAEAAIVVEALSTEGVRVHSVCCKCCGIAKSEFGLPQIRKEAPHESMCNPLGQAEVLNREGCELNFAVGLCVGHDAAFCAASEAPVVTLIAKDRVTGHNPAAALYVRYLRRRWQT